MNNNHGHGQSGHGHDGSLYGYGNAQDDFSTPFNNDGPGQQPGFADPASFMNSNFNSHFDQEMNADPHDSIPSGFFHQSNQQPWQQPQFFDPSQMAPYQALGDSASNQSFTNPYGTQLGAFHDLPDNSTFTNFPPHSGFGVPPPQEDSMDTINPHAIQTPDEFVYQQQSTSSTKNDMAHANEPRKSPLEGTTSFTVPQPAQPEASRLRFLDTDITQSLDSAMPAPEKDGWLSIRSASKFKAPAEIAPVPKFPFLNIGKEAFDSAEARVVPPPRRVFWSVNELERKLKSTPLAGRDSKVRSLLESKVSKAKQRGKPTKALKQRKVASTMAGPGSSLSRPAATTVEDVSEDDSSSEASDNESEYVSDSDEVIEEEPSPLPPSRPDDPVKAEEYDTLKCVWARSAVRIGPDDVKRRMAAYLDVVRKLRQEWKAAAGTPAVVALRKRFETVLRLTTKHGHHNFIESIDQLTPLASVLAAGVVELVKANLWDDGLLEAMLELIVKIPNIDPEFLKTTKLDRQKDKIAKKTTKDRIKDLASFIQVPSETKAVAATVPKQAQSVESKATPTGTESSAMSRTGSASSQASKKPLEQVQAAAKKPMSSALDSKKIASSLVAAKRAPIVQIGKPGSAGTASATGPKLTTATKPTSSKPGDKAVTAVSNGTTPKPVIRQVIPSKPTSMFASLTASKKPSTPVATAAAAVKPAVAKPKTPEPKATAAPAPKKSTFSFADTLANLGKPKEEPKKSESKEQRPPETEEQRAKRLRKEERRKLRVKWKPDNDLCAIRIFDHGQDDETMHDASEVADAADLKSEGQAFKRQLRRDNVAGVEAEDEEEQEYIDWYEPRLTDFTSVYERKPGDMDPPPQNVESRADGPIKFTSAESGVQQQREQGVMIELYGSLRDIPPCPKEPADPYNGKTSTQYDFGAIGNCGANPPVPARLADRNDTLLRQYNHRQAAIPEQPAQPADLQSILAMLGSGQQQAPYQPPPQQYTPAPAADPLSSLLAQFSGSQPPAPAPQPAANPYQDAINLFNSLQTGGPAPAAPMPSMVQPPQPPPQPPAGNADLSSILASLANAGQAQPQSQAPMPVAPPQPLAASEAMPGVDPSLLGWLNQYNASTGQTQQTQQAPNGQANWSGYGNAATDQSAQWLQQLNAMNGQNGGAANNGGGNDRKRAFDDDNNAGGKRKAKKPFTGTPFLVCRYYKEGRCQKGSECTFLHE